ncbi:hypothetical protein [Azospirillum palustre]
MTDTQRQQPAEQSSAGRSQRDAHALLIITYLSGQPTREAFFAAWQRLLDIYVATGMEAGWSREVAEEVAEAEIEHVADTLSALGSRFIPTAGRC